MKFKCIKDYFMHVRYEDEIPELGFKAGDVYTFFFMRQLHMTT